jgi:hypothetical protein
MSSVHGEVDQIVYEKYFPYMISGYVQSRDAPYVLETNVERKKEEYAVKDDDWDPENVREVRRHTV